MAEILCHNNGRYNFYLTISDGFRFESSLSRDQLDEFTKEFYGIKGLQDLNGRLERAHENGTSSYLVTTLEMLLVGNRAGENESELSVQECIDRFLS